MQVGIRASWVNTRDWGYGMEGLWQRPEVIADLFRAAMFIRKRFIGPFAE